jgi:hypothetical protein
LPQQRFRFEDFKFPSPFWIRDLKSLEVSMGFVLALYQIAMDKCAVIEIERFLSTSSRTACHGGDKNEKENAKR